MEALFGQIRSLAQTADEAARKRLQDGLRNLAISLETPQDSMQRIMYANLQLALARLGCDLKIFRTLADADAPVTLAEIGARSGVNPDPVLLARVLRYLASVGDIAETDVDTFAANGVTKALAIEGFEGGVYHNADNCGPAIQALPAYLAETGYRNLHDNTKTPLQKAQNTDLPAFLWMHTQPINARHFNNFMQVQRMGMPTWLDVYPFKQHAAGLDPARVLFVDIGGGIGHQAIALRQALPPDVKNRIVVQDIPPTLAVAKPAEGVEFVPYDFYTPQPIHGAKIYYMRNIMHDYPEDKALAILANVKAALAPDSVLLIDDMVVPSRGARWETTQIDILMMAVLASMERTLDQWHALLDKAGLKIVKKYCYTDSLQDHIIECVPA